MNRTHRIIFSIMVLLLHASLAMAEEKTGGFLSDLADQLKSADQELSEVNAVLKQQGQEFEKLINKEVEEGMVKLNAFNQQLNQEIEGLRSELNTLLSEDNLQKLNEYLNGLSEKVIASIYQDMTTKLAKRLNVTPEQWVFAAWRSLVQPIWGDGRYVVCEPEKK